MSGLAAGRVVVLSPHLDDAVLGLGAAMARTAREGADVRVVTVFAGNVHSGLPASRWDALAGFATEGAAALARRSEDAAACALLGAVPEPLPLPDYPYVRGGREPAEIAAAVRAAIEGADAVFAPGFPLTHPDHRLLAECVLEYGLARRGLALYAEQPYRFRKRARRGLDVDKRLARLLEETPTWTGVPVQARDRLAKWRAARAYRSQLPLLDLGGVAGVKLARVFLHEARHGGEVIAWVTRPTAVSSPA
jgi:LmbE family N-acetylglucosaminyl deacetylase